MSQPPQPIPTQSPTPSKSSIRRTSSTQNPSQRSLIPSPSPRFDENPSAPVRYSPRSPPNQTLEYESDEDDDGPPINVGEEAGEDPYFADQQYREFPQPDRPFQSFFTLIEDDQTSEHYHPSVHYIFADDDTELITEAAIRSLEQNDLGASSGTASRTQKGRYKDDYVPHEHDARLPLSASGVKEHYLILDVHPVSTTTGQEIQRGQSSSQNNQSYTSNPSFPSAYSVVEFTSLSSEWQVFTASITSAPTINDQPSEDESLMLRIKGRGCAPVEEFGSDLAAEETEGGPRTTAIRLNQAMNDDRHDPLSGVKGPESLEDMIERFQSRLGEVRSLIEKDNTPNHPHHVGTTQPYRESIETSEGEKGTRLGERGGTGGAAASGDENRQNEGIDVGVGIGLHDIPGQHEEVSRVYGLEERD